MNISRLYTEQAQSPWLDNLRRDALVDGSLQTSISSGIRGLTSNPTIFQKAISGSKLYDEQFFAAIDRGLTIEVAYWELVVSDIRAACDLFAPLHQSSRGSDGFVSVEVSPALCHDAQGTIDSAKELSRVIDRPNVMIKIPATDAGIKAISAVIAEGISVNVTLIFGPTRYREVIAAHQSGLEKLASTKPSLLPSVASVASFFISRVDNAIDPLLAGTTLSIGRTAIAQAKVAYQTFLDHVSSPNWKKLADKGAQVQRPLWASTSTKNPAFPATLYVDELIGPHTVNTLPDSTIEAFERSGTVTRTLDVDVDGAAAHLDAVRKAGVDLEAIARQLETEGLDAFASSFDDLLATLASKAASR